MITFIILIAALGLIVVLMNEYGWADLTGKTRNDLVFETRNKSYGAYEIREKYSNRLLIAFVGMLGFISIAAVSPKMFMNSTPPVEKSNNGDSPVIENKFEKEKKEEKKEEVVKNEKIEKPQPPAGAATQAVVTPTPTSVIQKVDSTKNNNAIVAAITTQGDSAANAYFPQVKNPGTCLTCKRDSIIAIVHPQSGVDEQASFAYGPYLQRYLKIPTDLGQRGVKSGKIYITFIVDETGAVTSAKVQKGIYTDLDNEARRVVSGMPKWKPAKIKGESVKVSMVLPINIVIEDY